jgi:hypothetical protein
MAGMDTTALTSLVAFRSAQHAACGRRRDALFDVCDAVLTAGPVTSPAHLSLQPQHRRGWGSLYDALAVGAISGPAVEALLAAHPLAGGEPIYAVDASVWARCDAETSPGRAVYYHPSRHSAGKPVVAGWVYHWTWLVVLAYTQLRLARPLVADSRLPWERPLTLQHLTPSRVRRGFWRLLLTLGSPAKPPKPCGRSEGASKRQALWSSSALSRDDQGDPERCTAYLKMASLSLPARQRPLRTLVARLLMLKS